MFSIQTPSIDPNDKQSIVTVYFIISNKCIYIASIIKYSSTHKDKATTVCSLSLGAKALERITVVELEFQYYKSMMMMLDETNFPKYAISRPQKQNPNDRGGYI